MRDEQPEQGPDRGDALMTTAVDERLARLTRATAEVGASSGFSARMAARLALEHIVRRESWVDVLPQLSWRILPVAAALAVLALVAARLSTTAADVSVAQAAPTEEAPGW